MAANARERNLLLDRDADVSPVEHERQVVERRREEPLRLVEIVLADAFSRDATREIAAKAGVAVLEVSGGRAAQMNAGAASARVFSSHASWSAATNRL